MQTYKQTCLFKRIHSIDSIDYIRFTFEIAISQKNVPTEEEEFINNSEIYSSNEMFFCFSSFCIVIISYTTTAATAIMPFQTHCSQLSGVTMKFFDSFSIFCSFLFIYFCSIHDHCITVCV